MEDSIEERRPRVRILAQRTREPQDQPFPPAGTILNGQGNPPFRVTARRATLLRPQLTRRRVRLLPPQRGWEEYGWRLDGNRYVGEYAVGEQRWRGRAETPGVRNRGAPFDFYVHRPPARIRRHPHYHCWHHTGGGWYWVHYNENPPDLLSGIKNIEQMLFEALQL